MARITGKSMPSCFSITCVETDATTETISFPAFISGLISGIQVAFDRGLQPLMLQGLKPLIRRSFSSGLKSRPPNQSCRANNIQIGRVPLADTLGFRFNLDFSRWMQFEFGFRPNVTRWRRFCSAGATKSPRTRENTGLADLKAKKGKDSFSKSGENSDGFYRSGHSTLAIRVDLHSEACINSAH